MSDVQLKFDTSSVFTRFDISSDVYKRTMAAVSPLFLAILQNKISEYAEHLATAKIDYDPDPAKQTLALIQVESRRARLEILQELMAEIVEVQQDAPTNAAS